MGKMSGGRSNEGVVSESDRHMSECNIQTVWSSNSTRFISFLSGDAHCPLQSPMPLEMPTLRRLSCQRHSNCFNVVEKT